jgi:hypothetical protein
MVKFIMAFLCSFLLWKLVKLSFSFNTILAKTSEGLYDFAESAMAAVPIPGTDGIGVGAALKGL